MPTTLIFSAVLCVVLAIPVNCQDHQQVPPAAIPAQPAESADFTFSKRVDEVNLILSVTDLKGRFVNDLTPNDLTLLDAHQPPAKWNYFQARTNLPLSVILAIDISSSVRDRLDFEQRAASSFLRRVLRRDDDEAAIIAFGSTVEDKAARMTGDKSSLDKTIRHLRAGGETALYDAIVVASDKLRKARKNAIVRPLIIIISDGVDTASKSNLAEAVEAATRSEAAIFALDATSIYETKPMGRPILGTLTRETGGFVLPARENSDLRNAFNTIEKILRNQYALGYAPPNLKPNGEFHPIEVSVHKAGLRVHSRRGYYAPHR